MEALDDKILLAKMIELSSNPNANEESVRAVLANSHEIDALYYRNLMNGSISDQDIADGVSRFVAIGGAATDIPEAKTKISGLCAELRKALKN